MVAFQRLKGAVNEHGEQAANGTRRKVDELKKQAAQWIVKVGAAGDCLGSRKYYLSRDAAPRSPAVSRPDEEGH